MKQQEIEKTELETVVELWKKNNIKEVVLTFDCGGDSMGNMDWEVFTDKGNFDGGDKDELITYFDGVIFDKVEFYEVSDGHYQGENGTVCITLDDDENDFHYFKDSVSELNETIDETFIMTLTKEEYDFVTEYVEGMEGEEGGDIFTEFKKDFIMTVEQEKILSDLEKRFDEEASEHEFTGVDGEPSDWYHWLLTDRLGDNEIEITVQRTFIVFEPNNS